MLKTLFTNKYGVSLVLFVLCMLFPELALAGPFDPPPGDKSKEIIIDSLFGPISGGPPESPLTGVIEVFNTAVLFIGGILLAYTLVAGTMQTAHDGEMLGKKWSSLWLPIRTAIGVAAILPIKAGFCFAQIVVVWLALQGVGIADQVWSKFVDQQTDVADTYVPPGAQRPIRLLLNEMARSSACLYVGDEQAKLGAQGMSVFGSYKELKANPGIDGIQYGPLGECGVITIQRQPDLKDIEGDMGAFFNTSKFEARMYPIHAAQLKAAYPAMEKIGGIIGRAPQEVSPTFIADINKSMDLYTKIWSDALQKEAKAAYAEAVNQDLVKSIKEDGWMMAGMWYVQFAKAQDAVSRGVSAVPNAGYRAGPPRTGFLGPIDGRQANAALERADVTLSASKGLGQNAVDAYGAQNAFGPSKMIAWFINDDFNTVADTSANLNENPVIMAANLGSNMSTWGWSAWIVGVAAGSLSTASGAGFSLGAGFATMTAPMLTALAGTIIVAGATLSTYIPMLPFILWVGVVLGWAVLLVEAVVAAPLWAVTHLAPDGDGVVGRGGQGYMLVLSLTLRPALMVIGFVAAVILMKPIGYFINSTFFGAFISNVSPGWNSLAQVVTGCVIYTMLMVSVITRVFALIHVIPDRLLRWIGGGGSNELGQEAHGIESHTGAKAIAGVAAAQSIGQAGQQGIQNAKNLKAHSQGKLAQDAGSSAQQAANAADNASRSAREFDAAREEAGSNPSTANQQRLADATEAMQQSQFSSAKADAMSAIASAKANPKDGAAQARSKQAQAFLNRADDHVKKNGRDGASLAQFAQSERQRTHGGVQAAQQGLAQAEGNVSQAQKGVEQAQSGLDSAQAQVDEFANNPANQGKPVPAGLSKGLAQAQSALAGAQSSLSQAKQGHKAAEGKLGEARAKASVEGSSSWAQAMNRIDTAAAQAQNPNASLSELRSARQEGAGSGEQMSLPFPEQKPESDPNQSDLFANPNQGDLFDKPAGQSSRPSSDGRLGSTAPDQSGPAREVKSRKDDRPEE